MIEKLLPDAIVFDSKVVRFFFKNLKKVSQVPSISHSMLHFLIIEAMELLRKGFVTSD